MRMANKILYWWYKDFIDITVVSVPDPAMMGKATGTILPALVFGSPLKNSIPNTISKPRINNTMEPAMAKEDTSNPSIPKNRSPKKKNSKMRAAETSVARPALICPILFLNEINTGIEPKISITANKANVAVSV